MTKDESLEGFIVRGHDLNVLCTVARSRNKAKSRHAGQMELGEASYKDIRAERLDKYLDEEVDWSEYGVGQISMLDMIEKGLHGWVDNVECPVCGAKMVTVHRDSENGLWCENCIYKDDVVGER